jgi:hypothetical protein
MRNLRQPTFVGAVVMACVGLAWAGEDDARAIVRQSIDAIGGEASLAKHKAQTFTEKGTYYGAGEGLPFTGHYAVQWPDKFRMEIEGVFTVVLSGDKGWLKMGDDVKEMNDEQLATQRHDHKAGWMSSLLPLLDKAFTLKTLPEAKVGDRPVRVVAASRKEYPDVTFSFDKTTHYLVKMEYRTKAAELGYKEVTATNVFDDYKVVDGVKVPHKMEMRRDGKIFVESEVVTLKAEGKLDAATFAMPK